MIQQKVLLMPLIDRSPKPTKASSWYRRQLVGSNGDAHAPRTSNRPISRCLVVRWRNREPISTRHRNIAAQDVEPDPEEDCEPCRIAVIVDILPWVGGSDAVCGVIGWQWTC